MRSSRQFLTMMFGLLFWCPSLWAQLDMASPALLGTVLSQPEPAADFSLVDQKGDTFRLSSTKGKVVVLSFIYTHCADICPFMTMKLVAARDLLGADSSKAVFVAITTDPERDTQAMAASYSKEAGLYDYWHFLTGSPAEIAKVWTSYGVGVHKVTQTEATIPTAQVGNGAGQYAGLEQSRTRHGPEDNQGFAGGYDVSHTAPSG